MSVVLERWNDDKMDALSEKVDGLGGQIREQRREIKEGFERIDDRFERMQQGMFRAAVLIIVALIGVIATHL
ncbi:MAG TPA: hypothetical protein VK471_09230 [Solirubrobacterales bacterium]|nr:hypothetical protein [Solirubrobacterales bacterium]